MNKNKMVIGSTTVNLPRMFVPPMSGNASRFMAPSPINPTSWLPSGIRKVQAPPTTPSNYSIYGNVVEREDNLNHRWRKRFVHTIPMPCRKLLTTKSQASGFVS